MSWGIRIAILYLGFVAIILTLVFTCMGEKIELESRDYYAKELKFQGQIDAVSNAMALEIPIDHVVKGKQVEISIPALVLGPDFMGEVQFFRPSDASLDKTIRLQPDPDGKCVISDPSFAKGVYRMRISVKSDGKNYFEEEVINFR